MVKGQASFSLIDADKLLAPIMQPGSGASSVPGLKTIVLDPGHGGNDAGMINKHLGICEKNLTLDTVLRLKKVLESNGYRVILTRKDDRRVELPERPAVAEKADADLFVSVHFNSVEQGAEKVTGVEVFTMTPQYQLSTDQKTDPQYASIPNPGNAQDHWNAVLGFSVHKRLLQDLEIPDRGLKRGRLAVLRLCVCPAVLIESGYLSNEAEARKLGTSKYRQRIAEAIAAGIHDYAIAIDAARRMRR
ncbi:MAG: N-acetylmuramoyl-L-alanine amidase, partial [Opitutaceae bacterium]|jgi:N-acetylmuramoyl-L-alanine amidase